MKNYRFSFFSPLFLSGFLALCNVHAVAQSAELDTTMWYSKVLDIEPIAKGEYVIAKQSYFHRNTKVEWIQGNTIKKSFYVEADLYSLNLRKSQEGVILEATSFLDCDVIFPRFATFLIDTISTKQVYLPFYTDFSLYFPAILGTDDGSLVLLDGQDRFLRIKTKDDEDVNLNLPSSEIRSLKETRNYVIAYGGPYVYYYEKGVFELDSIFFEGENVLDLEAGNEDTSLFVMMESVIKEISFEENQELNTYEIEASGNSYLDILYANRLYLLRSSASSFYVDTLNKDGKWTIFQTIDSKEYALSELYNMKEDGIWAVGQFTIENFGQDDFLASSIIFKLDNTLEAPNNIGIHNVLLEKLNSSTLEFSFTLSNHSEEVLEDIIVYSTVLSSGFCSYQYLEYRLPILDANTDTSIVLEKTLNFLAEEIDLCLYVLGSGSNPDLEMDDNIACLLFSNTHENENASEASVYPNPVEDMLYVDYFNALDFVSIYSFDGRLIEQNMYQSGLNVSNLKAGIYLIVREGKENSAIKFVKLLPVGQS